MSRFEREAIGRRREAFERLAPGESISFEVMSFNDGLLERAFVDDEIDSVFDGGFYGRALTLKKHADLVVKTTQPDPKHEFLRLINWRELFPPQTRELSAQHDHLASRIIHRLLPYVTSNPVVYSPNSLGYAKLGDGLGFAQVLERIDGRSPRFDLPKDEIGLVERAQKNLLEIGTEFGLEHIGQIHPRNPFAFANLWVDESGGVCWLDTLPAIPHRGIVLPWYYFRFHQDIRKRMNETGITFNGIHTQCFRRALWRHKLIPAEVRRSIKQDLLIYEKVTSNLGTYGKQAFVPACVESDLLTEPQGRELIDSPFQTNCFAAELAFEPWFEVVSSWVTDRALTRFLKDEDYRKDVFKTLGELIKDKEFRYEYLINRFTLAGVNEAFKRGLITKDELIEARKAVKLDDFATEEGKKQLIAYTSLSAAYFVSGRALDIVEGYFYLSAPFKENPASSFAIGFFIGWVVPAGLRPPITWTIGKLTGVDMRMATLFSAAPKIGPYLAIPANLALSEAASSSVVWHYTVRNLLARISKLSPSGGWGSKQEAKLWKMLPKFIKEPSQRKGNLLE